MHFYDVQTVYLVIGVLYVLLPATAWLVLSDQRSRPANLWCGGGLVFSVSCLLFGMRNHAPEWLTFSVANYLLWLANLLPVMALREQLHRPQRTGLMLVCFAVCVLVFEYWRLIARNDIMRFEWSALILLGLFATIHRLSLEMARTHQMRSARWLSAVFFVAAGMIGLRCLRVAFGLAPMEATESGIDNMLTVFVGLLTAVLGNFAFVGTYLERASQRSMQEAIGRAKQEASLRFGTQIAHLDRQRALGTMSSAFAHELSQPLTAILMDTQNAKNTLSAEPGAVSDLSQTLNDIQQSSQRAVALLERIRNFIKPTQTTHQHIALQTLVQEVTELMHTRAKTSGASFRLDFDAELRYVLGDRIELSQILVNVLRNAIEAMQDSINREITVRLSTADARCVLTCTDTGAGISPTLQHPVGTPFITSKPDGLGLGFSISRAIAEKHGGSLNIANALQGGACVTLVLPQVDAPQCAASPDSESHP